MNAMAPIALGLLRQYREGWNSAANGAWVTDCPYPEDFGVMSDWSLWQNGLSGYYSSPFPCKARSRYNAYQCEVEFTEAELASGEVQTEDDFSITIIRYEDNSAIVITPTLIHAESKQGIPIASCERKLPEKITP